ncbi:hypothetical protein [Streptomyces sp. NPDC014734]
MIATTGDGGFSGTAFTVARGGIVGMSEAGDPAALPGLGLTAVDG